jgi:biotin carboxyl carrier protein
MLTFLCLGATERACLGESNPPEVLFMRSIKRNLFDLSILGGMALALALAWGSPFSGTGSALAQDQAQPQQKPDQAQPSQPQPDQAQPQQQPDQSQPQQPQPDQSQAQTATFTGTVVKHGADYLLRDSSGAIFKLDDTERAKPFAGKTVKVTGELDEQAKVIHVESIVGVEA